MEIGVIAVVSIGYVTRLTGYSKQWSVGGGAQGDGRVRVDVNVDDEGSKYGRKAVSPATVRAVMGVNARIYDLQTGAQVEGDLLSTAEPQGCVDLGWGLGDRGELTIGFPVKKPGTWEGTGKINTKQISYCYLVVVDGEMGYRGVAP